MYSGRMGHEIRRSKTNSVKAPTPFVATAVNDDVALPVRYVIGKYFWFLHKILIPLRRRGKPDKFPGTIRGNRSLLDVALLTRRYLCAQTQ